MECLDEAIEALLALRDEFLAAPPDRPVADATMALCATVVRQSGELAEPKKRKKRKTKEKKKKKETKLKAYDVVEAPGQELVIYKPNKSLKRAKTVSAWPVSYGDERVVQVVKKSALQPTDFDSLALEQKDAVTNRLCLYMMDELRHALESLQSFDQIKPLLEDADDLIGSVNAVYRMGSTMETLAKNRVILEAWRHHENLRESVEGRTLTKKSVTVRNDILNEFKVNLTLETLRRYEPIGALFDKCPSLMLLPIISVFLDKRNIFEAMLQRSELIKKLAVLQQKEDCSVCQEQTDQFVFSCINCKLAFHSHCMGYPKRVCSTVELSCMKCTGSVDACLNKCANDRFSVWLASEDCLFTHQKVKGDGACVFNSIFDAVQDRLPQKRVAEFIKQTAKDMLSSSILSGEYVLEEQKGALVEYWKGVSNSVAYLKDNWNQDYLDYVWPVLVDTHAWLGIKIYQWKEETDSIQLTQQYPEDWQGRGIVHLYLKDARSSDAHFELLIPK